MKQVLVPCKVAKAFGAVFSWCVRERRRALVGIARHLRAIKRTAHFDVLCRAVLKRHLPMQQVCAEWARKAVRIHLRPALLVGDAAVVELCCKG